MASDPTETGYSMHEIDSRITYYQHVLSISSRSDPSRPRFVTMLALMRQSRHELSNQSEDLDKAILNFTESLLLLPISWLQHGPIIFHNFFLLAKSLAMRSKVSNQPEDVIYATKYLTYLRDHPVVNPLLLRYDITTVLVGALSLQVELKAGNEMQNIREMAVLSRELLAWETSGVDTTHQATHIILLTSRVVMPRIRPYDPDQPLDEVIEFLRLARKHRPDLLGCHLAFAQALTCRYYMTCGNNDYEEATSVLDEIISSPSPGNTQDGFVAQIRRYAIGLVTKLAMTRSAAYPTPESLEEAIYCTRMDFDPPFKDHPFVIWDPEAIAEGRFLYFGCTEGLGLGKLSSGNSALSRRLMKSEPKFTLALDQMGDLHSEIRKEAKAMKIDEAVKKGRTILASYSPTRTDPLQAALFHVFGRINFDAFERTNKIEYLNESINVHRQVIESPFPQPLRFATFPHLSRSLFLRSQLFPDNRTQDLEEAMELLSQCAKNPSCSLPDRFRHACEWAFVARLTQHPSVSSVYETALAVIQEALHFAPTLQLQHTALAINGITHSLPLDFASYRIDHHQLEEAIEVLEKGRALLWSEMRHLRASTDQLLEADPELGRKFAAVSRDLEELTKSIPPSLKLGIPADDGASDDLRAADPFGRLVLKRRGLLMERDKLISHIKALPRFDSFLASPSFDKLRSTASSGPVIIINHSKWRSDILVLLHNMPPSLIPTPDDFFERAGALKDKLLGSRQKYGLDSYQYDEALASVLAGLHTLVGRPVINRLRQLKVPEHSRIWWCPTSVFCSLPLHAMGPIPSDDNDEPRYFLDLYISSYTPTLSALIQSRHRDSVAQSSDRPSVLLVAQPDPSLPTVGGEIQTVQALDTEVTSLISETATPATVIDGFHHHPFVHFACHGTLEAGKPFEAGFELYGDKRLTLLEIVRSHLPTAEFAFLSACHTAEVTEGSVVDEALHLAAAVQYCGFRSVVGTMWAMADIDGRDLAKHFYKRLFSGSSGTPYNERSAEALRFAVKKLRRKRGITLERWVNFVHYGA